MVLKESLMRYSRSIDGIYRPLLMRNPQCSVGQSEHLKVPWHGPMTVTTYMAEINRDSDNVWLNWFTFETDVATFRGREVISLKT